MSDSMNQQILLKSYPSGEPREGDFALVETAIPEPGEGEILNRTIYLSLDPYMRGRMSERESYATPVELGFDACINRRTQNLNSALKAACPKGIDVYVDHTAGPILEAVLQQINLRARIPLVGLISQYNAETLPPGPNLMPLLIKRALIQGFLVGDYLDRQAEFLHDISQWLHAGKLKYKEDVVKGLENAPHALIGLLQGQNFGKLIVRVSDDPTKN